MSYSLAGYVIPPLEHHYFLVPIYEKNGEYFIHELNNDLSRIIAFHKIAIALDKVRFIPRNLRKQVTIGSRSIFAYQKSPSDVFIGTHNELKKGLRLIGSELDKSSHAQKEIDLFLNIETEDKHRKVQRISSKEIDLQSKNGTPPLSLALWSIRHLLRAQPDQILQLIKEWNFPAVEVAVFLDWSAPKLHDKLRKHDIKVCSLTGPALNPVHKPKYYVDWAKEYLEIFETRTLILQSTVDAFTENAKDKWEKAYKKIADLIVEVACDLAESDVRVSYHCYPYDFESNNGEVFVSRLFGCDDVPDNLGLQLDTYWLNYGQTEPDTYASLPIHSLHLNERDVNGRCCVLGTYEEKCAKYIQPLIKQGHPIDWILENDPTDEEARRDDKYMTDTFKKCFAEWPEFWRSLCKAT